MGYFNAWKEQKEKERINEAINYFLENKIFPIIDKEFSIRTFIESSVSNDELEFLFAKIYRDEVGHWYKSQMSDEYFFTKLREYVNINYKQVNFEVDNYSYSFFMKDPKNMKEKELEIVLRDIEGYHRIANNFLDNVNDKISKNLERKTELMNCDYSKLKVVDRKIKEEYNNRMSYYINKELEDLFLQQKRASFVKKAFPFYKEEIYSYVNLK